MATIVDTVLAQKEVVESKLQTWFESSDQVAGKVKKSADAKKISRYGYRFVVQQYRGGTFGKLVLSEGDMGTGSGMKVTSFTAGYFGSRHSFRVSFEQKATSSTDAQSVVDVWQKTLAEAIVESQVTDDITFHTDGTGKLTNASSASSSTTLTFAGTTDTLGVNRLREGMAVDVWDSTGATKRAGGPYTISNIDYNGKVVTFTGAVTGITSGDILAFVGMDAYGPSSLTSFSSTWPGGGLTSNAGLTGDSFRHGMYYSNDNTTANYYPGRQKSSISQLIPAYVNASSSALVFQYGQQILDQLVQRRDKDVVKGLQGIAHMSQRAQVFNIGTAISNKLISGTEFGKSLDLNPSNSGYSDSFDFCGIPCMVSKRQYRDRFDFLNFDTWGRAQLFDTQFYDDGSGRTVYPVRNSSGNLVTAMEMHLVQAYDFFNRDPGSAGYIYSLSVPSGY
jgi:hypothetical protein